jgi:hypothetical protein
LPEVRPTVTANLLQRVIARSKRSGMANSSRETYIGFVLPSSILKMFVLISQLQRVRLA